MKARKKRKEKPVNNNKLIKTETEKYNCFILNIDIHIIFKV